MEQDIKNALKSLIEKIKNSDKTKILTEEEVKQSFVLPFLKALGYDIFDTNIIKPEYTADIGTKKGEKVDYAILRDGSPLILIEVKHHKENLDNHNNQLVRYFQVCAGKYECCRFGILTNGIEYRFFSDIEKDNIMDKTPFLTINFEKPKERDMSELQRFAKDSLLNVDDIKKVAKTNLYRQQIQEIFKKEIENPSDDFVEFFARQIISDKGKRVTQAVKEEFREPIKKTLKNLINDLASDKITEIKNEITEAQKQDVTESEEKGIVTTEEELHAFYIVRSIFAERSDIALERITFKDTRSYFNVLLDEKVTKWICRFYFDGTKKFFTIMLESEKRVDISDINEIYKYKKDLNEALDRRVKNL